MAETSTPQTAPLPALADAERAFERGDWRGARSLARAALDGAGDDETRRAAAEMLGRFRNDRWLGAVFVLAGLFFVAALLTWLRR